MNRTKFPTLRVPQWPLASSSEAVIGDGGIAMGYRTDHPRRSMNINLRSEDCFEVLYLGLHVFIFPDNDTFSIEAGISAVHHANLADAEKLLWLLRGLQKRVDKVVEKRSYRPVSEMGDALMAVFAALGIKEVVCYRGIGAPDEVRTLTHSDIARYVTVSQRMLDSLKLRAA